MPSEPVSSEASSVLTLVTPNSIAEVLGKSASAELVNGLSDVVDNLTTTCGEYNLSLSQLPRCIKCSATLTASNAVPPTVSRREQ